MNPPTMAATHLLKPLQGIISIVIGFEDLPTTITERLVGTGLLTAF